MNNKIIISVITLLLFLTVNNVFAQSELKIKTDSLPSLIKEELKKKYIKYEVNSTTMITEKGKSTIYKIELQKKNNVLDLVYDASGTLISKSKSKVYSYDGTEKPKSQPANSSDGHSGHQH